MLKILGRLIGEDIELTWLPGEGVWPVRMDTAQIDQLLVNLCVNARDSIAGIGRITIETGNKNCDAGFCDEHPGCIPGKYVLITVSDDGCGMEKETVKKIFEPFFTTKGVGRGTGLGLATVYGIVKQNDGYIWVDTEPGQGTTFKIYLPRYQGKEKRARAEGLVEPAVRGNETVLMVEDEPAILDLGRQILEMQGYRMLIAGTPGEAIRMAIEHVGEIHLLLTDVIMPEMNGRELAEKLLSLYPGLKCLFMSGYTADVIAHHGVLDEGVQFIQKPFSLDALAAKVRATLDR
jgi:CheY-like chemotaxis protein